MTDIIADAKAWLDQQPQRIQTHSENCHKWHATCLVRRLLAQCKLHCEERDALLESQLWGVNCKPLPPGPEVAKPELPTG